MKTYTNPTAEEADVIAEVQDVYYDLSGGCCDIPMAETKRVFRLKKSFHIFKPGDEIVLHTDRDRYGQPVDYRWIKYKPSDWNDEEEEDYEEEEATPIPMSAPAKKVVNSDIDDDDDGYW